MRNIVCFLFVIVVVLFVIFFQDGLTIETLLQTMPKRDISGFPSSRSVNVTSEKDKRWKPRILCWVLTDPKFKAQTVAVRDTWASRCDITLFMSSADDKEIPTVKLDIPEGRDHLAFKTKLAWMYVYKNHFKDADFFLKADHDTYVLVDNLRNYMRNRDASLPEYYGHRFNPSFLNYTYMSGGAGYVLTQESVRLLVTVGYTLQPPCVTDGKGEDFKTAGCLVQSGARPVDTRDSEGRETFLVFHPGDVVTGKFPDWYSQYDTNGVQKGDKCCSKNPITMHYMGYKDIITADYLLYKANRTDHAQSNTSWLFYQNTTNPIETLTVVCGEVFPLRNSRGQTKFYMDQDWEKGQFWVIFSIVTAL